MYQLIYFAKAGKPLARVVAIDSTSKNLPRRIGYLTGHIQVPHDFDTLRNTEIVQMLGLSHPKEPR